MPLYSYTAKTKDGKSVHGNINAEDISSAKEFLQGNALQVEEVFEAQIPNAVLNEVPSKDPPIQQQQPVKPVSEPTPEQEERLYFPVTDTLRLYAGWLLAWYGVVYILGSYQSSKNLSFEIPYLMGIYYSPLVLSFTLGSFLFLLCSCLHRMLGRGKVAGFFCFTFAIVVFSVYRMNV